MTEELSPIQYDPEQVLAFALDMGTNILICGGETNRAEDTLRRIARAYGADEVSAAAVNSVFMATLRMPDGRYYTQTRRINYGRNNFFRLEELNALSRRVCAEPISIETARATMDDIENKYPFGKRVVYAGAFVATASFSIYFGGTWLDGLAAALVSLCVTYLDLQKIKKLNHLVHTVLLSFFSGILALLLMKLGVGQNTDKIFIGIIMMLIPGLATVNAIRDLLCGDVMTGLFRLLQSLITAVAIACGFALAVMVLGQKTVGPANYDPWLVSIIATILGTGGFAMIFRTKIKHLPVILPAAVVMMLIYLFTERSVGGVFVPCMIASLFAGIYAECGARVCKVPIPVFLVVTIIMLIPGSSLYYTMYNLIAGNHEAFVLYGTNTLMSILGIVVGVMVSAVVSIILLHWVRKIKRLFGKIVKKRKEAAIC